ncbi:MAG: M28 family peptidase [Flavobacteriales bacterium]|nr:M28 family peptidase [Flavobacteriales bacterium]
MRKLFPIILVCLIWSCGNKSKIKKQAEPTKKVVKVPSFNEDSAYNYIEKQVAFGPRVPNSEAHEACGHYLIETLKSFSDTLIVQETELTAFDGKVLKAKNIIASFKPKRAKRVMLCAHWDTRPFADQDEQDKNKPIDGANDGGSGVGVLLEIARQFSVNKPDVGVDIILFDAEDYGQPEDSEYPRMEHSYCLGSQYWAQNLHKPNYFAKYGILLDMVGGKDAVFTQEQVSVAYAPQVLKKVWNTASELGYGNQFSYEKTHPITDDHLYINILAQGRVPTIDIIEYNHASKNKFYKHWHTHEDKLEHIDKNTLKVVGQTVMHVVYNE